MKNGDVVKFQTPYPDEDPYQLYEVLEVFEPRVRIKALNTGMNLPPTYIVDIKDLIIDE